VRFVIAVAVAVLASIAPVTAAAPGVSAARSEVARLEGELARLDAEAGRAAAAHNAAMDRRDNARARAAAAAADLRAGRVRLRAARANLAERMVQVYVNGEPDALTLVLSEGSVTDALDAVDLLQTVARRDAALVADVRARVARLDELSVRLREAQAESERELARAQAERGRVAALVTERRRRLSGARAQLQQAIAARRARLARLAAAKRARERELRRARARAQARTAAPAAPASSGVAPSAAPAVSASGGPVFPLAGPTTFSDDWLAPRGSRYHEGIDLFAARGTPVLAVYDGTLFRVGYSGISGYRLWLRAADGTTYFYAHLDGYSPAAREGAAVRAGTVLGYNGDTGDAKGTPPHVHFEIHPGGGGPIRPYPIVAAWPRA